jgi:DNA-binding HxlR family transcriptional regulator
LRKNYHRFFLRLVSADGIIGTIWKPYLLFLVSSGVRRLSDLHLKVPRATRSVLSLQLKELQFHGIICKNIYAELPPHVEYYLVSGNQGCSH